MNDQTLTKINAVKGQEPEDNEFKLKVLLDFDECDLDDSVPLDYEEEAFGLGMLAMHGLITEDCKITPEGEKAYFDLAKIIIAKHEGRDPSI